MESFVPLCSVGLVFCFMMCSQAPATPTTNKMSSAERTPPISLSFYEDKQRNNEKLALVSLL